MSTLSPAGRLKSGGSDNWGTPQEVFDKLNEEFHFNLDACADASNHKCEIYCTEKTNGYYFPWKHFRVFCNPPYSHVPDWVYKAYRESQMGCPVSVLLIPNSTDTNYWHDYVFPHAEVRFVRGRINFIPPVGVKSSSNARGSAIVIFRPKNTECTGDVCYSTWQP